MPISFDSFCPRPPRRAVVGVAGVMLAGVALAGCVGDQSDRASHPGLANGTGDVPHLADDIRPGSVSGAYLAGRYAQARRDVQVAARYYKAAVGFDPDYVGIRRRAVTLLAMEGKFAEAAALAREHTSSGVPSRTLVLVTAAENLTARRYRAVAEQIAPLPQAGLTLFLAPLLESLARIDEGQGDTAAAAFDSLKSKSAFDGLRAMHLGILAYAQGHLVEAEAQLRTAIKIGGIDLRTTEVLGDILVAKGDQAGARELYRTYLKQQPKSLIVKSMLRRLDRQPPYRPKPVDVSSSLAEVFFGTASSLQQKRQIEGATIMIRLALYVRPDYPVAQYLLGEMMETLGRPVAAAKAFGQVAPDSPYAWPARLRRADLLSKTDQFALAISELEAMASERPDDPGPLLELGAVLRSKLRFAEAVKIYDRAIARMGPRDSHSWDVYYARGVSLERAGQWDRSEKDFLYALELEPDQPLVLNYLGYSWVEKGMNIARARKMIETAVELRPTDGYIVDSLGWVLFRTGDYAESVRYLEKAVELRPADPIINEHLGDVYWRVGRRLEAVFQWRRALSLDPEPETIAPIKRKIKTGI